MPSYISADKSRSFTARLKDKFRRHKSTENLHKASHSGNPLFLNHCDQQRGENTAGYGDLVSRSKVLRNMGIELKFGHNLIFV